MKAEHYQKEVVSIDASALVGEVAELMQTKQVGCVVVMSDGRPVGLITDRDLTTRVIAGERNAGSTPARAVMSQPLVSVESTTPLNHVVARMEEHAVRRVVVLRDGRLVGLISMDDMLVTLGRELHQLGEVARSEIRRSRRAERLLHLRSELDTLLDHGLDRLENLGEQAFNAVSRELESARDAIRKRFS